MPSTTSQQAKYWILTIPYQDFTPFLPNDVTYIKGQLEIGETTGYKHWQLLVVMSRKLRRGGIKQIFGSSCHCQPTRSSAANEYVWKEETRVSGTSFELGRFPINRGNPTDWDRIRSLASTGSFSEIPSDIFLRCHSAIKNIAKDHLAPVAAQRIVKVYWGATGTGKSRKAWEEAGFDAYPKDPMTKFWDGYQGQKKVVIDEFRGDISISHILRWFDRYPVIIEQKHGAIVLSAREIWVTSNLDPMLWYPQMDLQTKEALMRRLEITPF